MENTENKEGMTRLQVLKKKLERVRSLTPWEDIKVGQIYHIAPLVTLERRNIKVISKTDDEITYQKLGTTVPTESKMHKTSIFARLLVKFRPF